MTVHDYYSWPIGQLKELALSRNTTLDYNPSETKIKRDNKEVVVKASPVYRKEILQVLCEQFDC